MKNNGYKCKKITAATRASARVGWTRAHTIEENIDYYEKKYAAAPDETRQGVGFVLAMLYSEKGGFNKFSTLKGEAKNV